MASRGSLDQLLSRSAIYPGRNGVPAVVLSGELDYNEWRGCQSKTRFPSPADARRLAKKHQKRHPNGHRLRPYECRYCGEWHLTSLDRAPRPDGSTEEFPNDDAANQST
jgi:hypothetical protein